MSTAQTVVNLQQQSDAVDLAGRENDGRLAATVTHSVLPNGEQESQVSGGPEHGV